MGMKVCLVVITRHTFFVRQTSQDLVMGFIMSFQQPCPSYHYYFCNQIGIYIGQDCLYNKSLLTLIQDRRTKEQKNLL